ncbi:MAG: RES family NAD+ phosphorylase [Solirubrobacteraceae bacterium]|nr:RES family NAD+ phosphorylase [Solirubrobacteraceae bacterium]
MASWRTEPERVAGAWWAFRQVAPDWPALYHAAGEPLPSQRSGRWHRQGQGYVQYLALEPLGAWAELVRYEGIRTADRAAQYLRRLWLAYVREEAIADLSTFDRWDACGLDPSVAVGDHEACRALADELRDAGYRGVLSPSAALVGGTTLALFGARYEKVLLGGLPAWANPQPELRIPCTLAAQGGPPDLLLGETVFSGVEHEGLAAWRLR